MATSCAVAMSEKINNRTIPNIRQMEECYEGSRHAGMPEEQSERGR